MIQLCDNMDSLFKLWSEVLLHNDDFDRIFKCFIERVQEIISHDDAFALEQHFIRLPKGCRDDVSGVFRNHALFLLESPNSEWTNQNINAIQRLLKDDNLNWRSDDTILSLELIFQSHSLELLNIFPELSDTRKKRIPNICVNWFTHLLTKLGTSEKNTSSESNFIFSVFQRLERIYPLLGQKINVWRDLTEIAVERVKGCSENRIYAATKLIMQIKQVEVKKLFLEMIKEILNKAVLQTNDQLLNKIFIICDCKDKFLEVPNS